MSILTLTGPTCAGKSTIEQMLMAYGVGRAISHTTRLPRAGEVNGEAYHFVTDDEFERLLNLGEFIEVVQFGTNRYAMSKSALQAAYKDNRVVAIVVEPHGAIQIHDYCNAAGLKAFAVWVDCDPKEQARRWVTRFAGDLVVGSQSVGAYAERLHLMMTEEQQWRAAFKRTHGLHVNGHYREFDFEIRNDSGSDAQLLAEQLIADVLKRGS